MTTPSKTYHKKLIDNRKALRDYFVLERHEAGIELRGTEVKSIRSGQGSLTGAFARMDGGELILYNLNIPAYEFGNRFNHDPDRPRRLLLHRVEINKIKAQVEQKGLAVVPLALYLKKGLVKVEIGVCKGKTVGDKRETLRRKTADREAERAMAHRR